MTINLIGIALLWIMGCVLFILGWVIGHDKGYIKARKEYANKW